MYTDETILAKGRYKFTALCRVPADYLLNQYKNYRPNNLEWDRDLVVYVEDNLERIYARLEGRTEAPRLDWPCSKITYIDKQEANSALHKIQAFSNAVTLPVRSYECSRCGFWHLTSKSKEEYEQLVTQHQQKI
ncbi:hypothetical protein GCM10027423_63100 [Spirosoma arcticum]